MKEIRFEYTSNSRRRTLTAQLPERLGEASSNQFMALQGLSQGSMTEETFYKLFFGIGSEVLARLDPWQLYVMTEQLRSLWNTTAVDHFIFEEITVSGLHLQAPAPRLRGMSLQQFMSADQFWQWYAYTERAEYLHSMVAALYLPDDADFFNFDHGAIAERIARHGDEAQLQCIAVNWALIREWLASAYPHLFPTAQKGSSTLGGQKPRPGSWLTILDALVGDDLTRLDTYPHLPAMDVIRILNRRIADQKKPKP